MTTENETLFRRWVTEVWEKGDMTACDRLMAKDLVDHNAIPGLPGRASHDMVVAAVREAFPDATFSVEVVTGNGDLVAGRWTMTATHTGMFRPLGAAPTGRKVTMTGSDIFRIAGGKIVEVWHNEDSAGLAMQLR